jgi:hypothetical protein
MDRNLLTSINLRKKLIEDKVGKIGYNLILTLLPDHQIQTWYLYTKSENIRKIRNKKDPQPIKEGGLLLSRS